MPLHKYLLSLGSNIGSRSRNINKAVSLLGRMLSDIKLSSIYESDAMLLDNLYENDQRNYLNLSLTGLSNLDPVSFLHKSKKIERDMGRDLLSKKWSPRIIDIDILLIDNLIINTEELQIPHQGLSIRDFMLIPSIEVWPTAMHPVEKTPILKLSPTIITNLRMHGN